MKSPFPGMDPYLERDWEDVHHRLVQYASDTLQPDLPDDLVARVEQRVFVECDGARLRSIAPDVRIAAAYPAPEGTRAPALCEGAAALIEPPLSLDLQSLIDQAYAAGRYHKLDHRIALDPPLLTEDAAWATDLLRAAGKR
ncbi:MAG: DUF4058 family protein [Verrucomicrobia bacterium]|nr:DUF4058 family protein [Verrucomicrobiota bacterium]